MELDGVDTGAAEVAAAFVDAAVGFEAGAEAAVVADGAATVVAALSGNRGARNPRAGAAGVAPVDMAYAPNAVVH